MMIMLGESFYYRVKDGDTIQNLSQKFNAEKNNIIRNNNDIDLYVGEWVFIKQNNYIVHIVKPCETLEKISNTYMVNKNKIMADNDMTTDKVFIGQKIKIHK